MDGFIHFTMALSVESVHKGMLCCIAEKQQTYFNSGVQFMNIIVCIIRCFHCSCLLMPCMFIQPCLCTFPVYPCHVRCLFIHAMYVACLSMPCMMAVYPCHVRCLFIHTMYAACLSIPSMMAVYPCHVRCLFIHAMHDGCLSMPCMMAVYPCHV